MITITVKQQTELGSKQWGVYVNGVLTEGGYFAKANAETAATTLAEDMRISMGATVNIK